MDAKVRTQIQTAIEENEVLLFMKGTKQAPSCGFSARTVEVLGSLLGDYATIDVLAHPEVRDGIKEYSSWPTIPQLYIKGEFVGGADIIAQLYDSGELHKTLGLAGADAKSPQITVTPGALKAFQGFLADSNEVILLEIDREFQTGLSVGPLPASSLVCSIDGVRLAMDRLSATRAEGLNIDYIETPEGPAFKLNNPNEPTSVKALSVVALKEKLDAKQSLRLIDVRTPQEWETAKIIGAELLDNCLAEELSALPKDTCLVFQCHHGIRSQRVADQYLREGFVEVYNLTGGIDAWSKEVDPSVPKY